MRKWRPRGRNWFAVAALAVVLVSLLPPAADYARRYVFAESLQFSLFAIVVPALFVLGAPWRLTGLSHGEGAEVTYLATGRGAPADRLAMSRLHHPAFVRASVFLAFFAVASIVWRLPVAVDALARHPALALAEMASLLVAGTGLWLEIIESPPFMPRIPRPQRALVAASAMWITWILAYILGFSRVAWFSAYIHVAGGGLSAVADQEAATITIWAVAGICFIPVVYGTMMVWLTDSDDPDDELRRIVGGGRRRVGVRGWDRPSRAESDRP
ncbi:MAG TPA: cytochrome c oxidase assembly protein [Streptosporangiaceae bacterium]|nr:cytochrome c oxidase assembly protein [Streptosporangiaceae bacterium]